MKHLVRRATTFFVLLLLTAQLPAAEPPTGPGLTPPRLSLIDGPVSFWRTGAADWSEAALNTPLAAGDALYSGDDANLELQIGNRAFVRAGEKTQLSIVNIEADYLQFRVADGQASFDLRALPSGLTIEVNTPNAVFIIERSGYYRLNVDQDTTSFATRRGGRATVTPSGGVALGISPSEEVIVEGTGEPTVETYAVPEPDRWDRWNYERTDHLVDALSSRYVPPDVYGAEALDNHGDWRVEATYGALWVPRGVPVDWAPYSDGRWIWDPHYGWTWIDNAPWGWAPFHYGRWVHLNSYWAWAPGPVARRTVYSPALVAFFDNRGGASVSVGIDLPGPSWVALSWGEPLVPWWGRTGFIGVPWWGGWNGPRVIHNVTQVTHITKVYHNTRIKHAVMTSPRERFGHDHGRHQAVDSPMLERLAPVRGGRHPVRPGAESVSTGTRTEVRPTREILSRPAVTIRRPREMPVPWRASKPKSSETAGNGSAAELRFVPRPRPDRLRHAPVGRQDGPERTSPPQAPRFDESRRPVRTATPASEQNMKNALPTTPTTADERRPEMSEEGVRSPSETRNGPPQRNAGSPPNRRNESFRPRHRPETGSPQVASPPTVASPPQGSSPPRGEGRPDLPRGTPVERHAGPSRDEVRSLPGNPANRMSPKRRNEHEEKDERERDRPDRDRRN